MSQPRVWILGGPGYKGWKGETILGSPAPRANQSIRVVELEPIVDLLDRLCLASGNRKDLAVAVREGKWLVLKYGNITDGEKP